VVKIITGMEFCCWFETQGTYLRSVQGAGGMSENYLLRLAGEGHGLLRNVDKYIALFCMTLFPSGEKEVFIPIILLV